MEKKRYSYWHIQKLYEQLLAHAVTTEVAEEILAGGEAMTPKRKPEERAAWMGDAMVRMDRLLDPELCQSVREGCACCLGGKRLQLSKQIFATGSNFEERIKLADQARFVFGHSVELLGDGKVAVQFSPDGLPHYSCPCLKAQEPLPLTYCMCCGGHVKHHLQTALGAKLLGTVVSSSLSSGGKRPCRFEFEVVA